jgi:hypothetical protein
MPYSGEVETPAASKYAFQLEGQAITYQDIVMSNLVVTPYEGYDVLEASEDATGIKVELGVDATGNILEGSKVYWNNTTLAILSSEVFTKTYSEELATDVYSGKLVVDFNGGSMGLNLTMYGSAAGSVIDVVITNASITADFYNDGFGGTYEVYDVTAQWEGGKLEITGLEKEFEGFLLISYETENDFFSWMSMNGKVTTVDNVMTISGLFDDYSTGNKYNVSISGQLPTGEGTGLDNIKTNVKAEKMIKNAQLIIKKNGVEYNVQGAILK